MHHARTRQVEHVDKIVLTPGLLHHKKRTEACCLIHPHAREILHPNPHGMKPSLHKKLQTKLSPPPADCRVLGRRPLGSFCAPPADRCTTTAGGWVSRPLMEARRGGGCWYRKCTGVKREAHIQSHVMLRLSKATVRSNAAALSTRGANTAASAGDLTYPLALPSPIHVLPHSLSQLLHSRGALGAAGRPWSRGSACTC
jgi:hypothetical protein